jgi:hypothetical protein
MDRRLQVADDKAALGPVYGGPAHANADRDRLVAVAPASAASKICTRLSLRAECLPPLKSAAPLGGLAVRPFEPGTRHVDFHLPKGAYQRARLTALGMHTGQQHPDKDECHRR